MKDQCQTVEMLRFVHTKIIDKEDKLCKETISLELIHKPTYIVIALYTIFYKHHITASNSVKIFF